MQNAKCKMQNYAEPLIKRVSSDRLMYVVGTGVPDGP